MVSIRSLLSRFIGLLALLLASAMPFAPTVLAAETAAPAERYSRGLLWRVSKEGQADSYIFGTMHLADPRVQMSPAAAEAFAGAKRSVVEAFTDEAAMQAAGQYAILPPKVQMRSLVGPRYFAKVAKDLERRGIPAEATNRLRPVFATIMLMLPAKQGAPLDTQLDQSAADRGAERWALETPDEQARMLANIPLKLQAMVLQDAVDQGGKVTADLEKMIKAYAAGDLSTLQDYMDVPTGKRAPKYMGAFKRAVFDERNVTMVERMQLILSLGEAFVAIGAGHLPGKNGVLSLLEQRGYSVNLVQ